MVPFLIFDAGGRMGDENMPKVDGEIRAVCMMTVSGEEENS